MENFWIYVSVFLLGALIGVMVARFFWKRNSARIGEIYISPDRELYMALDMTIDELSNFSEGLVWIKHTRR